MKTPNHCTCEKKIEVSMIVVADTTIDPWTVVIHLFYTLTTCKNHICVINDTEYFNRNFNLHVYSLILRLPILLRLQSRVQQCCCAVDSVMVKSASNENWSVKYQYLVQKFLPADSTEWSNRVVTAIWRRNTYSACAHLIN